MNCFMKENQDLTENHQKLNQYNFRMHDIKIIVFNVHTH